MASTSAFRRLSLAPGELLRLDDARGTTVRVGRGQIWLTQYGDLVDHVLDAGQSWAVERDGLTVLQAQDRTIVDLVGPGAPTAVVAVASPPESSQLAGWLGKAANDWIDRRWAPYL